MTDDICIYFGNGIWLESRKIGICTSARLVDCDGRGREEGVEKGGQTCRNLSILASISIELSPPPSRRETAVYLTVHTTQSWRVAFASSSPISFIVNKLNQEAGPAAKRGLAETNPNCTSVVAVIIM